MQTTRIFLKNPVVCPHSSTHSHARMHTSLFCTVSFSLLEIREKRSLEKRNSSCRSCHLLGHFLFPGWKGRDVKKKNHCPSPLLIAALQCNSPSTRRALKTDSLFPASERRFHANLRSTFSFLHHPGSWADTDNNPRRREQSPVQVDAVEDQCLAETKRLPYGTTSTAEK